MSKVNHLTTKVNGVEIFYREAGQKGKPVLVLLHGYPTSSHMYRNLLRDLADQYHLIAPDYPGFGRSEQPLIANFEYTFENFAKIVESLLDQLQISKFSLYLMDYGAPVGFRIASRNPSRIENLIIQNGCAYEEGLETFWDPIKVYWNEKTIENGKPLEGFHSPEGLQWQYTHGVVKPETVSPDTWELDLRHLTRPENNEIQLALFYDYRTNVKLYPEWQNYFRNHQPRTLIVYGKDDYIFPASGAEAFKKDLKNLDFNLYDTGHFALESFGDEITQKIREFLSN
ncbi:MAG: alpha/beta hydrolase [Flavobacterium sp.]|uniref:alpha/beta fold hydrolase n=1 Tax=Flavobacterium sp. TaxID=239 RepID=UPI0025C477F7|nr:alpha/beta hydrolase [Flavobacterium sp.]MCK6608140.1 alpha/beta hydrolase [Flavobacterium sp.]